MDIGARIRFYGDLDARFLNRDSDPEHFNEFLDEFFLLLRFIQTAKSKAQLSADV